MAAAAHHIQGLALRSDDHGRRQGGHAILLGRGGKVIGIDLYRHVIRRQLGDYRRLTEHLGLHLFADAAPRRPEVDQHKSIRLSGHALGVLQGDFPTDRLLSIPTQRS